MFPSSLLTFITNEIGLGHVELFGEDCSKVEHGIVDTSFIRKGNNRKGSRQSAEEATHGLVALTL